MQEQPSSLDAVYSKYYGTNGFTINPNGGQVFFEIDFKEGVDYKHTDGLFNINDQIRLWKYPPSVAKKIKGIAYLLINVKSTFRGGAFTQELTAAIPPFGDPNEKAGEGREEQREGSTASAPTATGTATVGSTGTRQDPPLSARGAQAVNTPPATAGAGLVTGAEQASLVVSSNTNQVSGGQTTVNSNQLSGDDLEEIQVNSLTEFSPRNTLAEVAPINSLRDVTVTARRVSQPVADDDGKPPVGLSLQGPENSKNREDDGRDPNEFDPFIVFR